VAAGGTAWPIWVARPKVYQDVQKSVHFFTVWFLLLLGALVYWLELPPAHRRLFGSVFGAIKHAETAIGTGLVMAGVVALGWWLIFDREIYDKWWDKHVVQWRYRYSVDFIIPRLYRPFDDRLGPAFYKRAEERPREFLQPFYFFVGDDDHPMHIPPNFVTRFYVRVTKYWITQVVEVFTVLALLSAVPYAVYYGLNHVPTGRLLAFVLIAGLLLFFNGMVARSALVGVREATEDEIEAIHSDPNRLAELEKRTEQLCSQFALSFGA
jgi:hypothetical protein